MSDAGPPCVRCKKRGLSCTVNKSLQMILENDMSYVYVEHELAWLTIAVGRRPLNKD